jgi:isopentenyl diphosphate isomerase/L-lactate dehydrogenase-like FMN-dependent dehydrogenase
MRLEPINLYDYEARAKPVLPHNVWDFIDAGAMDEANTLRNRTAFEALTLRPRVPSRHQRAKHCYHGFRRGDQLREISGTDETPGWEVSRVPPLTWKELEWLRGLTALRLVLKGLRTAEDTHIAVESGVENDRPGVKHRLGIEYASIEVINPRLV